MMFLSPMLVMPGIGTLLQIGYVVLIVLTIAVIIRDKREPVNALAWITVIALFPVVGMALYIMFGRNRRKEKIFNYKELKDLEHIERMCAEQLRQMKNPDAETKKIISDNRDIITLLLNNNKAVLTMHNRVTVLNNGKATFAALLEALKAATSTIHIEYYIFENDRIGNKIARVLMDKARKGVEVRFIYDDVGSWGLKSSFTRNLRKSGVKVRCFMPVVFPWLTSSVNYRNHRKIIVVDGKVAFTGGINIADRYLVRRGRLGMWRDTHLQIEGEGVAMLQAVFMADWYFVSREQLIDTGKYFPKTDIQTESPIQIVSSGPDSDWQSIMQAFFAAITRAQRHIYISTPYFLPNQAILTALKVAALSGIDVRLMIPSRSDSKIVYWATRSYVSELIDAGISVYMYRKGFNHSKVVMIDGTFSSIGTANMDVRSFEHNFEVTGIMYDPRVAEELEGYFLEDLRHSTLVTRSMWDQRSNLHGFYESMSRLLSPLL